MTIRSMYSTINSLFCKSLLISDVELLPTHLIRVATKFVTLNNSYIDLFVEDRFPDNEVYLLSDFGQTHADLADQGVVVTETQMDELAAVFGLKAEKNSLCKFVDEENFLPSLFSVGQACSALAMYGISGQSAVSGLDDMRAPFSGEFPVFADYDLQFSMPQVPSRRSKRSKQKMRERLLLYFDSMGVKLVENESIALASNDIVEVDVLLLSESPKALMLIEGTKSYNAMARRADHAFAIHSVLRSDHWFGDRYCVLDDDLFYRFGASIEINRLNRVCGIIPERDIGNII